MWEMLLSTSEIFSIKTPLTNMVEYKEQTAQTQLELELIKVLLIVQISVGFWNGALKNGSDERRKSKDTAAQRRRESG